MHEAIDIEQALHCEGPGSLVDGRRHAGRLLPLGCPVDEGPVAVAHQGAAQVADQTVLHPVTLEMGKNSVDGGQVILHQGLVSEVHHVVIDHHQIVDGEGRNHIALDSRGIGICHTVGPLGPTESLHGLAGQSVIGTRRIGIKDFRPAVHGVLQLLIEGAVDVSLVHAALQGADTDIPDGSKCRVGNLKGSLHIQRVAGFPVGKLPNREGFVLCLDGQTNEAESPDPVGLVDFRRFALSIAGHCVNRCMAEEV